MCRAWPGAGAASAPRRLAAFGDQRQREHRAAAGQTSAGLAPVTARRGNTGWGLWRLHGPQCRRQTFVAGAAQSIPPAYGARAVSAQQRATGSAHQAARRALACTWRRILSRGGKDRTPYDDATDLTALKRRGSSRLGCVQKSSKSP